MLLLHGNPTWSFLYRKIIAALKDQCRCVALDYPGYGMSNALPGYGFTPREHSAVLERFVDRLGLTDLTIMVQDWGGPVGFGFAGRRPELVRRLKAEKEALKKKEVEITKRREQWSKLHAEREEGLAREAEG